MTDLDHLHQLYGQPDRPTNAKARPKLGDTVTVTQLDGVFTVESFDRGLYTLRSRYGVTLRAGVLVVRAIEQQEAA